MVVSGVHTALVLLKNINHFQTIAQTRDDAVGEAFDKVAKLLDLDYPGGPIISQKAENADKDAFALPRPMINSGDFNFSFSGLKTAVRYEWEKVKFKDDKAIRNMCASFQQACIDVLLDKTIKEAKENDIFITEYEIANNTLIQDSDTLIIERAWLEKESRINHKKLTKRIFETGAIRLRLTYKKSSSANYNPVIIIDKKTNQTSKSFSNNLCVKHNNLLNIPDSLFFDIKYENIEDSILLIKKHSPSKNIEN